MICLTGRSDITLPLSLRRAAVSTVPRGESFRPSRTATSSVMVTSSPTRMPPVSSAAFQVRPKSLRLILVVAETADAGIAPGIFRGRSRSFDGEHHLARDAVNGQVARRPPVRRRRTRVMRVDLKDSVGNFSTSKKSALFRCASRWASRVLIEAASIEASTRDLVRSDSSRVRTPVTLVNCPFTLEIIMCLTLNSATE